jgi:hypothetical protein
MSSFVAKQGVQTAIKVGATGLDVGGDLASAGVGVAQNKDNPEQVASSVVGAAGNIGITAATSSAAFAAAAGSAATGIGVLLAIVQITFAFIDMYVNPFKTYFNKDLKEMKQTIDEQINVAFLSSGYGFPLEVKPPIMPATEEEWKTFRGLVQQYYDDNGLISKEEVLEEENLARDLRKFKRLLRVTTNPYFETQTQNLGSELASQNLLSATQQNMLSLVSGSQLNIDLAIAAAIAKKKGYTKPTKKRPKLLLNYFKYKPKPKSKPPSYNFFKNDWQLIVVILSILISSIISLLSIYSIN